MGKYCICGAQGSVNEFLRLDWGDKAASKTVWHCFLSQSFHRRSSSRRLPRKYKFYLGHELKDPYWSLSTWGILWFIKLLHFQYQLQQASLEIYDISLSQYYTFMRLWQAHSHAKEENSRFYFQRKFLNQNNPKQT